MAFAFIAHEAGGTGANSGSTLAINTTGATFLAVCASWYNGTTANITISDSKGNTWTALTKRSNATTKSSQIFYCLSPTVGTGHTFTASGTSTFPNIYAGAFSGVAAYESDTGAGTSSATSLQPGSLTPAENNCLCISGINAGGGSSVTVNSSYSAKTVNFVGGSLLGGGGAYLIQTAATATNPTWSWTTSSDGEATLAIFRLAATNYSLSGPSVGVVNVASTNFTVTPDSPYTGTVTPHSTGTGTFSPTSLTWSAANDAKTFTYTPTSTSGSPHTISTTSSPALTDPASIAYTVNPAPTPPAPAANTVSLGLSIGL